MTQAEFGNIAAALRHYYPSENILPSRESMVLWYEMLQDLDYQVVSAGLKKWVATNKYSPRIADIRAMAVSVKLGDRLGWEEAWEAVLKSIQRYGYYREEEALASLDETTKRAVRAMGGFKSLCESENQMADRAQFRDIYTNMAARKTKDDQIPLPLKNIIQGIMEKNPGLKGIERKEEA